MSERSDDHGPTSNYSQSPSIRILILDLRSQHPYEQAKPEVSPMDVLILPALPMGYVSAVNEGKLRPKRHKEFHPSVPEGMPADSNIL